MCILQQVNLRWNWSQRVKHCCTKSLGPWFVLVASRLPQLPAVCTQDFDLPTNICQPFPEQQQNCMALHNQKQSLYTFSLFGKTFFPLLCDRWLQRVIKRSLGLCSRLFIKIIAPILKNGSPCKGESKSNNRRDKKESKVVKITLVLL